MSDQTGIEWTDATWNPIRGCSRVSEGCRHCYAERVAARFGGKGQPYEGLVRYTSQVSGLHYDDRGAAGSATGTWNGKIKLVGNHLQDPLRWQKPRMIFVNSMSDLFHENVKDEWIDQIFAVMACAPRHTFQVLTKRPKRMREYCQALSDGQRRLGDALTALEIDGLGARLQVAAAYGAMDGKSNPPYRPWPNVWLGVSVEDQATADARIPELLKTPAAVRFVSYEPALGPVDFRRFMWPMCWSWDGKYKTPEEAKAAGAYAEQKRQSMVSAHDRFIDWLICGGESGPGARPMHPDWARSARDHCQAAGVKFFFKQWGEWVPCSYAYADTFCKLGQQGNAGAFVETSRFDREQLGTDLQNMERVGKKAAGRLLDGQQWNEMPERAAHGAQ